MTVGVRGRGMVSWRERVERVWSVEGGLIMGASSRNWREGYE